MANPDRMIWPKDEPNPYRVYRADSSKLIKPMSGEEMAEVFAHNAAFDGFMLDQRPIDAEHLAICAECRVLAGVIDPLG